MSMISKLRAVLALAGVGAAMVALPAAPASATTSGSWYNTVSVSVKFKVQDDDGIFGGYSYASSTSNHTLGLTPAAPYSYGPSLKSACAGGEVYGMLTPVAEQDGNGVVFFYTGLDIYEGTNCYNDDWDGYAHSAGYLLYPGQTATYTFSVYDYRENSPGDKVTATVTVTNFGWHA